MSVTLEKSWLEALGGEFEKGYMVSLKAFLLQEKQSGVPVYPKSSDIFNALNHTPFDKVNVIILGQDPYHGQGQAHGLSFSVKKGLAVPPSLKNIYKELAEDFPEYIIPDHGELTKWADQGVLLLNSTLTVRAQQAGSHQGKGWEIFTDRIISELSEKREGIVFMLWGKYAQNKSALINENKHFILTAPHPSPFSAYTGFFGCKHFSKANEILEKAGRKQIDWQID